jgi:hypothetical protein
VPAAALEQVGELVADGEDELVRQVSSARPVEHRSHVDDDRALGAEAEIAL